MRASERGSCNLFDGKLEQLYFPGPALSISDRAALAGDADGTAIYFDAIFVRCRWLDRQGHT
ncbi:MAG: hypothetical protein ACREOE_05450 [Gemmatimonadales bacterium]